MSDNEAEAEIDAPALGDDHAHQACYIFTPFPNDATDQEQPAKKRRKIKQSLDEQTSPFPLLNHGAESSHLARTRHELYRRIWKQKQERIQALVDKVDEEASRKISKFIQAPRADSRQKLRTGLIISGPDSGAQARLLERWKSDNSRAPSEIAVQLRASHCVNLQTTLKNIIRSTISSVVGQEGYQAFLNEHKKLIPMNFDLELLQIFVEEHGVHKVVLSILDVETFDMGILSELFAMLHSWSESVPFILVLGLATTIELFESRLPKSAIDLLDATMFTLQSCDNVLEQILDHMKDQSEQEVHLGPSTLSALEEMIQNQGTTIEALTSAIKYAVMSHFYANSLSVLLGSPDDIRTDKALCQAIRHTSTFQEYCEREVRSNKTGAEHISKLLRDDSSLLAAALTAAKRNTALAIAPAPVSVPEAQPRSGKNSSSSSSSSVAATVPPWILREAHTINSRNLLNPFTPKSRSALERALSKPADYLGCECCSSGTASTASTAPPTSILYTLLQEAGTVINVRDLYDAFCARCFPVSHNNNNDNDNDNDIDGVENEDEDQDEDGSGARETDRVTDQRKQMSVFYTALAELRMLGLVKSNTSSTIKKRAAAATTTTNGGSDGVVLGIGTGRGRDRYGDVDFIAKTAWAGL